jgi:Protein of unknown function (DUF3099)
MIKYSLAMGIRMVCILSLLFVQGWWLVIMAAGAIVLPYIAVVLANVGARPGAGIEAPGGREVMLRNPQTPVVVPPAEDAPAEGSASARPGPGEPTEPRFDGGFGYGSAGRADGTPFPAPDHGPFAQPAGPSAAHPGNASDEAPSTPPTDRPAEGQA